MAEWAVYVQGADLARQAIVDNVVAGELRKRWNAPGAWQIEVDAGDLAVPELAAAGARIEVTRDGATVMAGPVSMLRRVRTPQRRSVVVSGADDLGLLWERVAHPQPGTASPPWSSTAEDARTGTLSTILRQFVNVNAGPGAVAARQVPHLVLGTDPATGASTTLRARYQPLGDLVAQAATAAATPLRIDVTCTPSTSLTFTVAATVDRSAEVQFSEGFGNLAGYDYSLAAPQATTVYVGGSGEGTARTFRVQTDSAAETAWRRIEGLVDRRDLSNASELDAAGLAALVEQGARTSLSIVPIETESVAWPVDYQVGDTVAVVVDGGRITDRVSEVVITLDATGTRAAATVGALKPAGIPSLFSRLRSLGGRLNQLERR